jgi:hypothetical protein
MRAAKKRKIQGAAPEVIEVPMPQASSFDPSRSLKKNSLLQAQVEHFHEINLQLPKQYKVDVTPGQIQTEGQASEYIRKVTAGLHAHRRIRGEKARSAT